MIWELGMWVSPGVLATATLGMTTVIGTAISMGLMLPATTINHQPLRTTILVMVFMI